jgi:hypothetical protein
MAAIIHRARWNFNVDEADGVSRRDSHAMSPSVGGGRRWKTGRAVGVERVETP